RCASRRVDPPAHHAGAGRPPVLHGRHPPRQGRIPAHPRDFLPLHRPVLRAEPGRPRRPAHRSADPRERRARRSDHPQRLPQRRAVLLQADARDRVLLRLWGLAGRARRVPLPWHEARRRRLLPEGQLPLPVMTAPARASLEHQLAAEQLPKRRQYVVANTRARWGIVGLAIVLLAALQAAVYLSRREVWQALAINVGAFAVATTLRTLEGLWTWSAFVQETLVLVFVVVAVAPLLVRMIERLQVARDTLAMIEGGDLTARVDDPEHDELRYRGLTLARP